MDKRVSYSPIENLNVNQNQCQLLIVNCTTTTTVDPDLQDWLRTGLLVTITDRHEKSGWDGCTLRLQNVLYMKIFWKWNMYFRLKFGLVNSINTYLRLKIRVGWRGVQPKMCINLNHHTIYKSNLYTKYYYKKPLKPFF